MAKLNEEKFKEMIEDNLLLWDRIDVDYIIKSQEFDNPDDLLESLQEMINETDITYYKTAMEFLSEHDTSLRCSLTLASERNYEAKSLDSEKLATILLRDMLTNELNQLALTEVFEEENDL